VSSLAGKTALVTGASRGIGRAIALRLARDGAVVAVHYGSSADGAERTVDQIVDAGGKAFAIRAKLGVPGDAETVWAAVDEHVDGVDIVVNNAGILGGPTPFADVDEPTYDEIFSVNTRTPFFLIQRGLSRIPSRCRPCVKTATGPAPTSALTSATRSAQTGRQQRTVSPAAAQCSSSRPPS